MHTQSLSPPDKTAVQLGQNFLATLPFREVKMLKRLFTPNPKATAMLKTPAEGVADSVTKLKLHAIFLKEKVIIIGQNDLKTMWISRILFRRHVPGRIFSG